MFDTKDIEHNVHVDRHTFDKKDNGSSNQHASLHMTQSVVFIKYTLTFQCNSVYKR